MRNGIYAAGNWIIDEIKIIDEYPHQDGLTNIREIKTNNGGAPYNVLKDLSFLGAPFPLYAAGLVGDDEKGRFIIDDIKARGVDVSNLNMTSSAPTSFTDVMTVATTGRRTFFHNRGANAYFGEADLNLNVKAKIFHMAYLLLLDEMDEIDPKGRSIASHIFEKAQNLGFKTSTDIVSEASERFKKLVPSSLPYTNYLFVNEYEASKLTDFNITSDGKVDISKAHVVVEKIIDLGVQDYVILHFPEAVVACDRDKKKTILPSINIPSKMIRGSAGAGDAFAAGALLGLHENWPIDECLKLGICAGAASLFDESCSEGVKSVNEVLQLEERFGLKKL